MGSKEEFYEKCCNNSEGMRILPAKYLNDSEIIGAVKLVLTGYRRFKDE